jgi:hypothetical protein
MSDPWQQPQPSGDWQQPQQPQQPQQSGDWQQPQQQPQQSGGGWQQPQPPQESGGWQQPQPAQDSAGWQQPQPTDPMQPGWQGQQGQQSGDWQQQSGDWQQQQQFGTQPYGGYGQQGYGYGAPPQQSNGMAIAGLILAFLFWPVGLVLSIIGFNKSKQLGGSGRGQALAGIIISPIVGVIGIGITVAVIAAANTVANVDQQQLNTLNSQLSSASSAASAAENNTPTTVDPADDPGCTSIESSAAALNSEMNNNDGNDSEAISYLQTFDNDVISAESQSQNTEVTDDLDTLDTDINNVIDDYDAIEDGTTTDTTQLQSDITQMETDADAVDTLCG